MPDMNESSAKEALSRRTARRRHDAAHFIERFAALTGLRVNSANAEALPREFLARTAPAPDVLVEQYGYELEPRTRNALCHYEPGRSLDRWTYGRLLEIRGLGIFSFLDLLEVLAKHGVSASDPAYPSA
jgi:hypothetical protein